MSMMQTYYRWRLRDWERRLALLEEAYASIAPLEVCFKPAPIYPLVKAQVAKYTALLAPKLPRARVVAE